MQRSLQRLREEADGLIEQNTKLKQQLEDKEMELCNLRTVNDSMQHTMEEMLRENSEAIEAAYEAKMEYENAVSELRGLMKQYKDEMKQWMKLRKKIE